MTEIDNQEAVVETSDVPQDYVETPTNVDGVALTDPQRADRQPGDWTDEELLAFVRNELIDVDPKRTQELVSEFRRRISHPEAWSTEDVLTYYRTGEEPAMTSTGAWKSDVTRGKRRASEWSNEELQAWVLGEVHPTNLANDAKLAAEVKRRFQLEGKNDPASVREAFRKSQDTPVVEVEDQTPEVEEPTVEPSPVVSEPKVRGALTKMNVSFIQSTLETYAETVQLGKPITDATGGNAQKSLDNLFQYVIRLDGAAFKEGMDMIKAFVRKHRDTLFNPSVAYRFVHMLKGGAERQKAHVDLIVLLMTATSKAPEAVRQMDLRKMVAIAPVEKQDLLVEYFTQGT